MTRTTRRETNRLRAEIMEGIAEYVEERDCAAKMRRCGTVTNVDRCGTVTRDVPEHWLRSLVLAASPGAIYLPEFRFVLDGTQRHQPLILH